MFKNFSNNCSILIHILRTGLESHNFNMVNIEHSNLFFSDKLIHWAVPIFVIISGALFLNKNKIYL